MHSVDVSGQLHQMIVLYGAEAARDMVPAQQRRLVDIAAAMLADEKQDCGFTYSGFCLTALPHKRLADDASWERQGHNVRLFVEPGLGVAPNGETKKYGVPYGARARMILLYLQTQAVKTRSRDVSLGRSMRNWMETMGIAYGGETAKALREQASRISACTLKFFRTGEVEAGTRASHFQRGAIVESGLAFTSTVGDTQGTLWEDTVRLDQTFYDRLVSHPVPLREAAIRELRERSLSLDIYIWLAWRLHMLQRRTPISWPALHAQFGGAGGRLCHFRPDFLKALAAALAAYPEARVEANETGVVLLQSPPPVQNRIGKGTLLAAV